MLGDDDQLRRAIRAQVDEDVAAFIAQLGDDVGSGVPPPPQIRITEVSSQPYEFDIFKRGRQKAETLPTTEPSGGGCTCPRECSEITGFTMSFTAHYIGDGVTSCLEDQCTGTQTWTRIDSSESFSAPHQFKLYLDNCESGGEIVYEDNRSFSPISFDCFGGIDPFLHGSFVYGSNSPNTGGCCNFVTVGSDVFYTMDFFAEGDSLCSFCVAELGDTEIEGLTICDMSALIGEYPVSEVCVDGFGGEWHIDALLEWF